MEERMGENYYFASLSKELEKTYLKYFSKYELVPNMTHKLEDVCNICIKK